MPHPIVSYLTTLTGMARAAAPRALTPPVPSTARWSAQRAQEWEAGSRWMMGCNFIPSNAGSQLEMWQPETWSPDIIEKELGWAADLGMNSVRVFLHDLLFAHEGDAFLDRVDAFHSYSPRKPLLGTIEHLRRYDRPLLCTEWMARTVGSPVRLIDVLADEHVSAWCWGLVAGRSQTRYSWTSWFKRPDENARWFHDLLHADGRPYDETEAVQLRTAAARMGAGHREGSTPSPTE